jgi:hypothetical protein
MFFNPKVGQWNAVFFGISPDDGACIFFMRVAR